MPRDVAFAWHRRGGALSRMIPPWENVEIVDAGGGIDTDTRAELMNRLGPCPLRWTVEHKDYIENRQFRDVALKSPFPYWNHLHSFQEIDSSHCRLEDRVEYELPAGNLGRLLTAYYVENQLNRMFRYRHDTLRDDLGYHAHYAGREPLRICITGATGLVGSALSAFLSTGGHEVIRVSRKYDDDPTTIAWDPVHGEFNAESLEGIDAVVHLAGENIGSGRWNEDKKQRIIDSRVLSTKLLCERLAKLNHPPRVLVTASAVGIYGSQNDAFLNESAPSGGGFLAEVCSRWESAAKPAAAAGIHTIRLRFGAVLSPRGGMLASVLPLFRLGLAGRVGDGRQWQSWISIDDAITAIHHAIVTDSLDGPVNVVSPNAIDNARFTATLARILHRPALLSAPRWALQKAFGEMADELLFSSIRAVPKKLLDSGYTFRHATLAEALKHILGRQD